MKIAIGLGDIVVKNLNCVVEGLSSKDEALNEIMEHINKNFISFASLGDIKQLKLGQIEQLKEVSGFEVRQEHLALSLTKQIPIISNLVVCQGTIFKNIQGKL